jgi:hypothetical protein
MFLILSFASAVAASMILLLFGIRWYSEFIFSHLVEAKHRDAEIIIATGCAPQVWDKRLAAQIGGARFAKRHAMRRIRKVKAYFERTPLVDSEHARDVLVSGLEMVQQDWKGRGWDEISASGH